MANPFLKAVLLALLHQLHLVISYNLSSEPEEVAQSLMFIFPENYSIYHAPRESDGSIVKLRAFMVPFVVDNIVGESMDFEVNFFLIVRWNDSRLTPIDKDTLVDEEEFVKKLWMPEIQFRNCRDCTRFSFKKAEMLLSYGKQEFTWYARKRMKFICKLNFKKYPMDYQECGIEIESYPSALELLKHERLPEDWMTVEDIAPAQFDIVHSRPSGKCKSFIVISRFKCVQYTFKFRRQLSYHMTFTFLPSIMVVMVSWISFWLDVTMVAPRAALGLTPLLALVTQFAGTQKSLPPVAYMKAIDLWMFICIFLVFASLAEFALATQVHARTLKNLKIQTVLPKPEKQPEDPSGEDAPPPVVKIVSPVDLVSRIFFPVAFLIFNIFYWSIYLS